MNKKNSMAYLVDREILTLDPIILAHVPLPTSVIRRLLILYKFTRKTRNHYSVNHKKNFVNPARIEKVYFQGPRRGRKVAKNVKIHTQNVERFNGLLKSYMKRYIGIAT